MFAMKSSGGQQRGLTLAANGQRTWRERDEGEILHVEKKKERVMKIESEKKRHEKRERDGGKERERKRHEESERAMWNEKEKGLRESNRKR